MAKNPGQGPTPPDPPKDAQGNVIPQSPALDKLVQDPDNLPEPVTLTGYVGYTSGSVFIRVYPDLEFRSYYELRGDDVLKILPVEAGVPDGPSEVLIKASAKVRLVWIVEASMLEGPIASAYPIESASESAADDSGNRPGCLSSGGLVTTLRCRVEGGRSTA
jgi:hypothetical protein